MSILETVLFFVCLGLFINWCWAIYRWRFWYKRSADLQDINNKLNIDLLNLRAHAKQLLEEIKLFQQKNNKAVTSTINEPKIPSEKSSRFEGVT